MYFPFEVDKKEIEVIGTEKTPNELNEFLYDIAYYVIENDITLNPGETIGFTAEQKFAITLSKGISLEELYLKYVTNGEKFRDVQEA